MLLLKYLLLTVGISLLLTAVSVIAYDIYVYLRDRRAISTAESGIEKVPEKEIELRRKLRNQGFGVWPADSSEFEES